MEITNGCNLKCPICFASANELYKFHPSMEIIKGMYQTMLDYVDHPICVQISGGEPTITGRPARDRPLGQEHGHRSHRGEHQRRALRPRTSSSSRRSRRPAWTRCTSRSTGCTSDVYMADLWQGPAGPEAEVPSRTAPRWVWASRWSASSRRTSTWTRSAMSSTSPRTRCRPSRASISSRSAYFGRYPITPERRGPGDHPGPAEGHREADQGRAEGGQLHSHLLLERALRRQVHVRGHGGRDAVPADQQGASVRPRRPRPSPPRPARRYPTCGASSRNR